MKEDKEYIQFKEDIEQATNEINQRLALQTGRKGVKNFRDNFAFYKVAMTFSYAYITIIQSVILLIGITPQAIENINKFFITVGIPFQFPVSIASILTIVIIFALFTFGVFAILFFGLLKRESEIGVIQSPGFYLITKQNYKITKLLESLNNKDKREI